MLSSSLLFILNCFVTIEAIVVFITVKKLLAAEFALATKLLLNWTVEVELPAKLKFVGFAGVN